MGGQIIKFKTTARLNRASKVVLFFVIAQTNR
jgi:hypothetical protein